MGLGDERVVVAESIGGVLEAFMRLGERGIVLRCFVIVVVVDVESVERVWVVLLRARRERVVQRGRTIADGGRGGILPALTRWKTLS